MSDTLKTICDTKREHIASQKRLVPESVLHERIAGAPAPRGFKKALEKKLETQPYALIAEIKKASPSAGVIRPDFDSATLAKAYEQGGAACLSVLTDAPYFQGDDAYLAQARNSVSLPCLRKDFILDTYQVTEARAIGADCILLIMAALEDTQAKELEAAAFELGMDVLVEVHDAAELARAKEHLSSPLIGINNRNLATLKVDLATSETLAKDLPPPILGVCESGLKNASDLSRMKKAGLSCFLVGESLMRQQNVTLATQQLLGTA